MLQAMNHWLVKQEPEDYSWSDFVKDRRTAWTGVRSYPARIHLRAMKKGELVLFYHSGQEKQVVGIARVSRAAYPDPTAQEGDWAAVDLVPAKPLARPVPLATLKADAALKDLAMIKQSRLSVSPVSEPQFHRLVKLAETEI